MPIRNGDKKNYFTKETNYLNVNVYSYKRVLEGILFRNTTRTYDK